VGSRRTALQSCGRHRTAQICRPGTRKRQWMHTCRLHTTCNQWPSCDSRTILRRTGRRAWMHRGRDHAIRAHKADTMLTRLKMCRSRTSCSRQCCLRHSKTRWRRSPVWFLRTPVALVHTFLVGTAQPQLPRPSSSPQRRWLCRVRLQRARQGRMRHVWAYATAQTMYDATLP
jgi:hypothetical protein